MLLVRMADERVDLESRLRDGVKNEVLRSPCQLVNTSELALEVSVPSFVASLVCSWTICSDMSCKEEPWCMFTKPIFCCCYAHVLSSDLLECSQVQLLPKIIPCW